MLAVDLDRRLADAEVVCDLPVEQPVTTRPSIWRSRGGELVEPRVQIRRDDRQRAVALRQLALQIEPAHPG